MKLSDEQKSLVALVERTADAGGGWRCVGKPMWHFVENLASPRPDVFDVDVKKRCIKLTDEFIAAQRFM